MPVRAGGRAPGSRRVAMVLVLAGMAVLVLHSSLSYHQGLPDPHAAAPDPHAAAPPPPTPTADCQPGGRAPDGSPCCCLGCCPGQFWQTHEGAPPLPWATDNGSWAMNASTVDYFVGMATGLNTKQELDAGHMLGYYGSE